MTSREHRIERLALDGSGFHRVVDAMHGERNFVLLESSLPGARQGRYSFASWEPFATLQSARGHVSHQHRGRSAVVMQEKTIDAIERVAASYRTPRNEGGLPPFLGGAVGYLGYEVGAELERLPQRLPDVTGVPRALFGFYNFVLVHDRVGDEVFLAHFEPGDGTPVRSHDAIRRAIELASAPRLGEALAASSVLEADEWLVDRGLDLEPGGGVRSDFTKPEYLQAVRRIKEYIVEGDAYQVNLTQRFWTPMNGRDPWSLYRRLAALNPAPFGAYLHFAGVQVLSSSPERFLFCDGRRIETRPIKGTAPRGVTPEEDRENERRLLGSKKDLAELAMIVDLMRNDLGRVCEVGSVVVDRYPELESYASVHQLVGTVSGTLRADRSVFDLLRGAFPAGSITGAPKIRAMEIIDELERVQRGVYTGSIGYVGFDGTLDLNVAIRTIVVARDCAHAHAGGGVVIDSDEAGEYEESRLKARNLILAMR